MPTYETTDFAIIDAAPERVFRALTDEYAGRTHWWTEVECTPVGDIPFGHVGAICRSTVRNRGVARFEWRTAEIISDRYIRFEYLEGDIAGYADMRLEPLGDKTRVEYGWRVRTRGKASIIGPLLNLKKRHSEVMQSGFCKLNKYLASVPDESGIANRDPCLLPPAAPSGSCAP
jgi:uncharacterized protein YndB with AHSA1/START domain